MPFHVLSTGVVYILIIVSENKPIAKPVRVIDVMYNEPIMGLPKAIDLCPCDLQSINCH